MGKIIESYGGKLWTPSSGGAPTINIIGYDGVGGSTWTSYNYSLGNRGTTLYTAVSPDAITRVSIYGRGRTGSATINIGIYETSSGLLTNLVYSQSVTLTTTAGWFYSAASFSLTNGVTYAVAFDQGGVGGLIISYYNTSTGGPDAFSVSGEVTLPSVWTGTGSFTNERWSCFATVER